MKNKEGHFSCLDFFLDFRETGLQIVDQEKLSLLLILLTFFKNVSEDMTLLFFVLNVTLVVEVFKLFSHLFVRFDIRAYHIIAEGDILEQMRFGKFVDEGELHKFGEDAHVKGYLVFNPIPTFNLLSFFVQIKVSGLYEQHKCGWGGKVVFMEFPILRNEIFQETFSVLDLKIKPGVSII